MTPVLPKARLCPVALNRLIVIDESWRLIRQLLQPLTLDFLSPGLTPLNFP
jgi:hypothetical protein